jgi:hypothetical protein
VRATGSSRLELEALMQSPFPGMDPYLEDERLWPALHRQLINELHRILLPGLVDRYRARLDQRHYQVPGRAEQQEDFLEIRQKNDGKLVTLLDVVSPTNKTTPEGRKAYLERRTQAKAEGAGLVEIDLLLQGQPMLDYSREGLPDWDYAVTVTRSNQPERYEIYTATLRKRLPRFRLPLAPDDRDTVLDLQAAFTTTCAALKPLDYSGDPAAPLSEEDYHWLDVLLVSQGLRKPTPPWEIVAALAYVLWEEEGRPHGRDREHWQMALQQLRKPDG